MRVRRRERANEGKGSEVEVLSCRIGSIFRDVKPILSCQCDDPKNMIPLRALSQLPHKREGKVLIGVGL